MLDHGPHGITSAKGLAEFYDKQQKAEALKVARETVKIDAKNELARIESDRYEASERVRLEKE